MDKDFVIENEYSQPFTIWIAILLTIFGLSSWYSVNGIWTQLPLLVDALPEHWDLPAYLSMIFQISNIAPFIYIFLTRLCLLISKRWRSTYLWLIQPPERITNYAILLTCIIVCALFPIYWKTVGPLPGLPRSVDRTGGLTEKHSCGLFSLVLFLGVANCLSSVTYLAYLARMHTTYAGALLIGRASSGLLPSLIALIQGVSSEPGHTTVIVNGSEVLSAELRPLLFSFPAYTVAMAIVHLFCLLAFLLLDCLPCGLGSEVTLAYRKTLHRPPNPLVSSPAKDEAGPKRVFSFRCALFLSAYTNCLSCGLLPSLQAFSTAAYSSHTYHLAVTTCGLIRALVALLLTAVLSPGSLNSALTRMLGRRARLSPTPSPSAWLSLALIASLLSGHVVYLAAASPSPPTLSGFGPALSVISWIMLEAVFTGLQTWITLFLVKCSSQRELRSFGLFNQLGSALGSLISFLLIVHFKVFHAK